ncbi:hypothetical protein EVAR_38768_1 [Eumeta japonica]|uniref:Uncharacterized protein n=1 Tax=Eumeta variegata TaxID=151549 RepID=A0A4C1WMM8_EUMVA|nr:hypothetical protein EVAR_38768_1 [Eumeta japonica]
MYSRHTKPDTRRHRAYLRGVAVRSPVIRYKSGAGPVDFLCQLKITERGARRPGTATLAISPRASCATTRRMRQFYATASAADIEFDDEDDLFFWLGINQNYGTYLFGTLTIRCGFAFSWL